MSKTRLLTDADRQALIEIFRNACPAFSYANLQKYREHLSEIQKNNT